MSLHLYNTLTRKKERFVPLFDRKVRMYVCGPTVYDYAHIGNARPAIVFDLLFRLLRHIYGAEHVVYARNITDVDDKINARAAEEGVPIAQITARTTAQYHQDTAALGVLKPTVEPRATDHIPQMIDMIKALIANGCAYEAEGHVLFHVPAMKSYGQLARRSMDEMLVGARIDVAPYKKDPMDFVLWKPSEKPLPGWDSPWGRGRPGWHIECSAMARRHLGEVFDIHGGGIDLVFPHHENEMAQSCCAHGTDVMANYWMHNGHLQVEGEKMSKSVGNFLTIHDLLKQFPGEALRLNMLSTHYRQPFNWTTAGVKNAFATLDTWYKLTTDVPEPSKAFISPAVLDALEDDMNTPRAITEMHALRQRAASGDFESTSMLLASARLMGLLSRDPAEWAAWKPAGLDVDSGEIDALIVARAAARASKDFAEADRIRKEIEARGVRINDGPDGTTWELAR